MKTHFSGFQRGLHVLGAVLSFGLPTAGVAATLQDFGFQHMTVNGQVSTGNRPLLVIVVSFTGSASLAHSISWYDDYFFNSSSTQKVTAAFFEMSNHRFYWSRGATVGPLGLPASMRAANFYADIKNGPLHDQLYASNIIYQTWAAGLFDFESYDLNHDGHVSNDELEIAILTNDVENGGAARWAGSVFGPVSTVDWIGNVGEFGHRTDFATVVHELSHTLGTRDLYGVWSEECLSMGVTLMSCTIGTPENPAIYHLDPWHKMQLGWCEPRFFPVNAGGLATIPAAQMLDPHAPIILYDPARGTGEFFMLEYRTPASPNGPGFDANVADTGLAVWRVQQDVNHNPLVVNRVDAGPFPAQAQWRFCSKCNGLHFISSDSSPSFGPCPLGGSHVISNSVPYQVVNNISSAPGQHGWRWCWKCQGLFFGAGQANSHCPAGGTHDGFLSGDYSLVQNDPTGPGQHDWRWCQKCQGLFYLGTPTDQFGNPIFFAGVCPASGQHDASQSGNYAMLRPGQNLAVWNEAPPIVPPAFGRGSTTLWHGGDLTPALHWSDGTPTQVQIVVRPFNPGDASITVEWWAEYDTWVDFTQPFFGNGTFNFPFNTLAAGLAAVTYGGNLYFKSSHTPETAHITKRMILRAYGGPVTLGR